MNPRKKHMPPDASAWLATRGWQPFDFQREVWAAMAAGESGLLHATTGAGKTYAVWLGALQALQTLADTDTGGGAAMARTKTARTNAPRTAPPLSLLWITPMRALAADTLRALQEPLPALAPTWTVATRTGDTSSGQRTAQNKRLPTALVTTPESLSLLLAHADAQTSLGGVRVVVVDEWHELLGNKRGVQLQLALARLKRWQPGLMVWGMSATLGNLDQALHTLLGPAHNGRLVRGQTPKALVVDTLLPLRTERFPWAGHLGMVMLPQVVTEIEHSGSTLVFTNTRAQAELWYQALLQARPDWAGSIALHHGSLDRGVREWVETSLKSGSLRAVVCTSSLDLGVDFLPVERVLQIGSAKGVARLLQRAGRSGHAPGRPSRITLVPTHSMELVEGAAVRAAVQAGHIEAREPPQQPQDVLVQHLVTVALGGGFVPDELLAEVHSTAAYANLSQESWQWCLDFVSQGGASLAAYPDYHRVQPDEGGVWRVPDARLARRHRANIGTIVSDASMVVQYLRGAKLGTVEESFAARLKPGDCFLFAGRLLELVRVHEMTAWVKRASGKHPAVPRWNGGRMPLSTTLADAVVEQLATVAQGGAPASPELHAAHAMLAVQRDWSALPTVQTLLAETFTSREGTHLFLYPFAGRHVHLGLASLFAWRVARHAPRTFSMAFNDYGFELLCADPVDWPALLPQLLAAPLHAEVLMDEVLASLNASELAQRRFREIARVSGLIFQSHPGEARSSKQLQASSSLFWEVFKKYDPGNRLLHQAESELLQQELDIARLRNCLVRMANQTLVIKPLKRPTPFAFPLLVERFREKLSNEQLADRIARMVAHLEKAAGAIGGVPAVDADTVLGTLAHGRDALADGSAQRPRRERKNPDRCRHSDGSVISHSMDDHAASGLTSGDKHHYEHCLVQWSSESLHLLPERALWWPSAHTLFIADLHLGKAASYRRLGQPVPAGSTQDNLQRLTQLIARHTPQHIVFLGDFLHAATGRTPMLLQALRIWRDQHAAVQLTLVRGNHDSHAGDPPQDLGIAVVDEPWLIGPFAACHYPQLQPTHLVLAGHNHPVVHLQGTARDRLRLPCFVKDEGVMTLPAFGAFTGGHAVEVCPGRRIYAVGGGRVWAIPPIG